MFELWFQKQLADHNLDKAFCDNLQKNKLILQVGWDAKECMFDEAYVATLVAELNSYRELIAALSKYAEEIKTNGV